MKIAFHTLGCKVNQYETEAMKQQFTYAGHEIVGEEDFADAYMVNGPGQKASASFFAASGISLQI